jgi:hypothetical protein
MQDRMSETYRNLSMAFLQQLSLNHMLEYAPAGSSGGKSLLG